MRIFIGIGLIAFLSAATVDAQIYKWVDEHGKTQYTDQPPPPGAARNEKRINIKTGISTQHQDESGESVEFKKAKSLAEERTEFDKRRQQRKEEEAKQQASTDENKKKCVEAKTQLSLYSDSPRLTVPDGMGGITYVDEEMRQKKINEANKLIATHCK